MKIGVIGTGYVGLVTAVGLADLGHNVIGTDKVTEKIEKASEGIVPIYEPGLGDLLRKNLKNGNLCFSSDLEETIKSSDVLFVCVNTPQRKDGSADMTFVEGVSRCIAENLNTYKLIVEKSTVPVRTSSWIKRTMMLYKAGESSFDVASNPEFLREGSAVSDFLDPDRIIIGVESDKARDILLKIYEKHKNKIYIINLISDLCEKTDADVEFVAKGMGLDSRIGKQFLRAGLGYGGSCFPKDVRALVKMGEDLSVDMKLLKEVDRINMARTDMFIKKVKNALWILKNKKLAVLGLSFKPRTDDIRNAPSIHIIERLLEEGARLSLYDPEATKNVKALFPEDRPEIQYAASSYQALEGANAALFVTEWEELKNLDLKKAKELMENPIIIDGRNIFEPGDVRKLGFEYYSIGRK
jgi:UDPglucose 6-dehydrogenase